ncbi:MAG: hypothetical protein JST42_09405, partial [Bacteroidetes bacterium]|nr:hypothetical protein [Bacteroidota bacterium]
MSTPLLLSVLLITTTVQSPAQGLPRATTDGSAQGSPSRGTAQRSLAQGSPAPRTANGSPAPGSAREPIPQQSRSFALTGVTLIDARHDAPQQNQTVLVSNGLIADV